MRQEHYFKFWAALLVITVTLTSCSYLIRADQANPYSATNYLSVDVELCGQTYFGSGGCHVKEGQQASNRGFVIGTFYKGQVEVISEACNVNKVFRYEENEKLILSFEDLLGVKTLERKHSCTFRMLVEPDYVEGSTETVYPRTGRFFLEVTPNEWEVLPNARADQKMKSAIVSSPVSVQLPTHEDGAFLFTRCDGTNEKGVITAGKAILPPMPNDISCKYQIAFKTPSKRYIWIFLRNVYERNTTILPDPVVTRSGSKLCVKTAPETSFLAIGDAWQNTTELCADNVPKGTKIRAFTVKRNSFTRAP